jgi:hypothetical protein
MSHGVTVWVDQWNIPSGANWSRAIEKAITDCASLLIVLSPASAESDEVQSEWLSALDNKKVVVPILYRQCDIPFRLKPIQYIDFTQRSPDDTDTISEVLAALGKAEYTPSRDADFVDFKYESKKGTTAIRNAWTYPIAKTFPKDTFLGIWGLSSFLILIYILYTNPAPNVFIDIFVAIFGGGFGSMLALGLAVLLLNKPYGNPLYVVSIVAEKPYQKPTEGCGFFINKSGMLVTNFHIIDGANKVAVMAGRDDMEKIEKIKILAKDVSRDLVCFSIDVPQRFKQLILPIKINSNLPEIGADICIRSITTGQTRGGLLQVYAVKSWKKEETEGIVHSIKDTNQYGKIILFDATVSPWASGSPLLNIKGEAIGVVTIGEVGGKRLNFAIPCSQVSKLIHYQGQGI